MEVLDEDSTTATNLISRIVPAPIRGAEILIKKSNERTIEIAEPLGATSASYYAEAAAALRAFELTNSDEHVPHIMWAMDSKSLIDALGGDISKAGDHAQLVCRAIEKHLHKGTEVSAVWVPAHCGIPENEQADKQANAGCRQTFSDHHVRNIPH